MRFIETDSGDYIAVDTIAVIRNVTDLQVPIKSESGKTNCFPGKFFSVITKRGDSYTVKATRDVFFRLILGA